MHTLFPSSDPVDGMLIPLATGGFVDLRIVRGDSRTGQVQVDRHDPPGHFETAGTVGGTTIGGGCSTELGRDPASTNFPAGSDTYSGTDPRATMLSGRQLHARRRTC